MAHAQSAPTADPQPAAVAAPGRDAQGVPDGYREAVDQALGEMRAGHFSEARALFVHAHELMPSARTLRGIGLAEFELRSYVESIEHFKQALESPVRPLSAAQRKETEEVLERANRFVTRLSLSVQPVGASISLDGQPLPRALIEPILLEAGDHTLHTAAPGHLAEHRILHALGGDTQRLEISLAPAVGPTSVDPVDQRDAEQPRLLRKNPWVWAGVGVLVAGVALSAGLLASRDAHSAEPYGGNSMVSIPGL